MTSITGAFDVVPARMINEWVYCPRLAYLEWVDGEWADSADTEDGRRVHRRVDQGAQAPVPEPDEMPTEGERVVRSLHLTSGRERITARMDVVEICGSKARPVDYKRGKTPDNALRSWPPERVQVAVQAMVLRDNGYECDEAVLYFAGSRERVVIALTDALLDEARSAAEALRQAASLRRRPLPLVDSPKCQGCSLAPICLPDELQALRQLAGRRHGGTTAGDAPLPESSESAGAEEPDATDSAGEASNEAAVRLLYPSRDDGVPLHVATQGARVGKSGHEIVVKKGQELLGRARLPSTSAVSLYGAVQVTHAAMRELLGSGIPVSFHSMGGWFYGSARGATGMGLAARRAQYAAADREATRLEVARRFVRTKIHNQRAFLRRNGQPTPDDALAAMKRAAARLDRVESIEELMGREGEAAAAYFGAFACVLRPRNELRATFEWTKRNRRPPTDAVNATLSFAYALLVGVCRSAIEKSGLDPMLGFLHSDRPGRPSLALDLMEEFRPVLADSVAVTMINTGELRPGHFVSRAGAVNLTEHGRKKVITAWEHRLDSLVTHPVFGYRTSWRKLIEIQARLLSRYLMGECEEFPEIRIR